MSRFTRGLFYPREQPFYLWGDEVSGVSHLFGCPASSPCELRDRLPRRCAALLPTDDAELERFSSLLVGLEKHTQHFLSGSHQSQRLAIIGARCAKVSAITVWLATVMLCYEHSRLEL